MLRHRNGRSSECRPVTGFGWLGGSYKVVHCAGSLLEAVCLTIETVTQSVLSLLIMFVRKDAGVGILFFRPDPLVRKDVP